MEKVQKTLLIMAAGSGSRFGALKQFAELGPKKEFLFEFGVYDAIKNGFDHLVVITKEDHVSDLKKYLLERLDGKMKIDVIPQKVTDLPKGNSFEGLREKPWGTAHAVWVAKDYVNNPFIVINADDYYGADAYQKASRFIDAHKEKEYFGMVPYKLKETLSKFGSVSRGLCKFHNGDLDYIKELKNIVYEGEAMKDKDTGIKLQGTELVSMNFWIFKPLIFEFIEKLFISFLNSSPAVTEELLIPDIIQKMIKEQIIKVSPTKECASWFGVTYANDKTSAIQTLSELTLNNTYPSPLWSN